MLKVLLKSLLFMSLLLVAAQLLVQPFVFHPFWGDVDYITKYDHFLKEKNDYNAVFVGSSRTFRHIGPAQFDSITGLTSFNFGIDGVGCPYNYWLTDVILNSEKSKEIDHLSLELFSPESNLVWDEKGDILHTDKVLYWYGFQSWLTSMQSMLQNPFMSTFQFFSSEFKPHLISLIESSFKIGFVHRLINAETKPKSNFYLGEFSDGYLNYDREIEIGNSADYLQERVDSLNNHPETIDERIKENEYVEDGNEPLELNHWKYIQKINDRCASAGIRLTLVVQPLMSKKQARYTHELLKSKPENLTVIDLSDSKTYPYFYQREFLFDINHLNSKGARILTSELADDFNQLVNPQNK